MLLFLKRFSFLTLWFALAARPASADPGFPRVEGAEPSWPDGPEGAFHPVDPLGGDTFYVDVENGLDTNDGSPGSPRKTIAGALELVGAGDTVVVLAGTYREQVKPPDLSPASTRSRPVTIRAEPPDGQSVILDGTDVVPVIEGSIQNPAGVSLYNDPAFVIEGFLIRNWSGYGLAVQQSGDVVVLGCVFADNGTEMADSVDMVVISSREVRVVSNRFDSATERGLDDRSLDTVIAFNYFRGHTGNAVKVGPHPAGQGSLLLHNTFVDNPAAQGVVYVHTAKGVTIQRNLLVGGSLQGIRLDDVEDSRVVLNTVVSFFTGIEIERLFGCRIAGNILANHTLGIEFLSLMSDTEVDGNLYFGNTVDVEQGDAGPHALFGDPGFQDPFSGDYSLVPGSLAENAGPDDLPVPVGGGGRVDLGAFESGAGESPWEYQPGGQVADLTPRFLWRYVNRDPLAPQGSYRVQVDRVATFDSPDLLDSNWQETDETGWTVPRGFELEEGAWYVRVKLQDADHNPSPWSDPHVRLTLVSPPACASQGGVGCDVLDGCDGTWLEASDDPRCCLGQCVACPDADTDGYQDEACGGADCDDGDAGVHPNADEDCGDGTDNDCDQLTDLDDPDCGCVDHDRDGYGVNCPDGEDCDDTIASVHPGAEELCNNVDDDCDQETDEGYDVQIDPGNCGECGYLCRSSEVCDLGECKTACAGGRTDCDRSCIDTAGDLDNCGGCGAACDLDHAGEQCVDGACQLTACEAGWVNQNGIDGDGCEYECTPTGEEICDNGQDDDCDGEVDVDCGGGDGGGGCGCGTGSRPLAPVMLLVGLFCALVIRRRRPASALASEDGRETPR